MPWNRYRRNLKVTDKTWNAVIDLYGRRLHPGLSIVCLLPKASLRGTPPYIRIAYTAVHQPSLQPLFSPVETIPTFHTGLHGCRKTIRFAALLPIQFQEGWCSAFPQLAQVFSEASLAPVERSHPKMFNKFLIESSYWTFTSKNLSS